MVTISLTENGNSITFVSDIYPDGILIPLNCLNYRVKNNKITLSTNGVPFSAPGLLSLTDINEGQFETIAEFKTFFSSFFRKATDGGGGSDILTLT